MTARATPARGCHARRDRERINPQVVVRFDRETFDQVRDRAVRERTSFAEQVRRLIEWGLEAAHG